MTKVWGIDEKKSVSKIIPALAQAPCVNVVPRSSSTEQARDIRRSPEKLLSIEALSFNDVLIVILSDEVCRFKHKLASIGLYGSVTVSAAFFEVIMRVGSAPEGETRTFRVALHGAEHVRRRGYFRRGRTHR